MIVSIAFDVVALDGNELIARLNYDPDTNTYELEYAGTTLFAGDWPYLVAVFKRAIKMWGEGAA